MYVDFLRSYMGPRSVHLWIIIVVDYFSKFSFLKPVKKFTADVVVKYLEEYLFFTFQVWPQ